MLDNDGSVIDEQWQEAFQQRDEFIIAVSRQEKKLGVPPLMSTNINSAQADLYWLIQMWKQRMPWILNYPPGLEKGVNVILECISKEYRRREKDGCSH
jgi:hypothetical protein